MLLNRPVSLISNRLSDKRCPSMSNASHQSSPVLSSISQQLLSCRGKCRHSRISLSSQRELPSVGATQEGVNLRDKIFNYVPGTVNTNRGAAVYESPDQAFSFQKHI